MPFIYSFIYLLYSIHHIYSVKKNSHFEGRRRRRKTKYILHSRWVSIAPRVARFLRQFVSLKFIHPLCSHWYRNELVNFDVHILIIGINEILLLFLFFLIESIMHKQKYKLQSTNKVLEGDKTFLEGPLKPQKNKNTTLLTGLAN